MRKLNRLLWAALLSASLSLVVQAPAHAAPGNDDLASATVLSGELPVVFGGSSAGATSEPGEPAHTSYTVRGDCANATTTSGGQADPSCQASVWWTWTPQTTGPYDITLCGSDFSVNIAVYTGDAIGSLTKITSTYFTSDQSCNSGFGAKAYFRGVASTPYRIAVAGRLGQTGTIAGRVETCSVNGSACAPPSAAATSAQFHDGTSAQLVGKVNPMYQPTTMQVEYGPDTNYGMVSPEAPVEIGSDTADHDVAGQVQGLTPDGATYHYRVVATNAAGTTYSNDVAFQTPLLPSATTLPATNIGPTSATLNGSYNPNGHDAEYHFQWGATTSYGLESQSSWPPSYGSSDVAVSTGTEANATYTSRLQAGRVYHYRVVASGTVGTAYGEDRSFLACGACSDFNADGKRDIVWFNAKTGRISIWLMNGTQFVRSVALDRAVAPGTWTTAGAGDFNADGNADILWFNPKNGALAIWFMDRMSYVSAAQVTKRAPLDWHPVAVGGFYSPTTRVLWRNTRTGQLSQWRLNGAELSSSTNIGPEPGVGYFGPRFPFAATNYDLDWNSGLLVFKPSTGEVTNLDLQAGWYLKGGTSLAPKVGPDWEPVGAGEFGVEGGVDDVLWRNKRSGQLTVWLMNRTTYVTSRALTGGVGRPASPSLDWKAL